MPSHASMLTGLFPPRHTVRNNHVEPLPRSAHTLAEVARESGFETAGLRQDPGQPQLFVTYHAAEQSALIVDTSRLRYGPGMGRGNWSMGANPVSGTVYTYVRGTLIIDVWDAETERLVWRGSAEGIVPEDVQQGEGKVLRAVDRMIGEWELLVRGS